MTDYVRRHAKVNLIFQRARHELADRLAYLDDAQAVKLRLELELWRVRNHGVPPLTTA